MAAPCLLCSQLLIFLLLWSEGENIYLTGVLWGVGQRACKCPELCLMPQAPLITGKSEAGSQLHCISSWSHTGLMLEGGRWIPWNLALIFLSCLWTIRKAFKCFRCECFKNKCRSGGVESSHTDSGADRWPGVKAPSVPPAPSPVQGSSTPMGTPFRCDKLTGRVVPRPSHHFSWEEALCPLGLNVKPWDSRLENLSLTSMSFSWPRWVPSKT